MNTANPRAGRPAYFTVQQSAWILGASCDRIHRAIRTGTLSAVRRNSRYEVPETALKHLLSETSQAAGGASC
jgi:hypothetical protein